ncbi:MAG: hypothetical protein IPO22_06630 [Anaerolineales bacterium]|jgi:hypothetical protein|nr:hypothetical protein [Anaerolineales bacterium]
MRKQREKHIFAQRGSIVRVLFYLNAAYWLFLSITTIVKMIDDGNGAFPIVLIGFFLLLNVTAMFLSGRLLDQQEKWTYIFALVVAVLNVALASTGIPDVYYLIALLIDVIILLVLLSLRNIYFK